MNNNAPLCFLDKKKTLDIFFLHKYFFGHPLKFTPYFLYIFAETSSTLDKSPFIDAQDDTPQSGPVAPPRTLPRTPPQDHSTPNKAQQDHTALTIVDLSIAEDPQTQVSGLHLYT